MVINFQYCVNASKSRDVVRFPVGQNIFETSRNGEGNAGLSDTIREGIIGLNGWYSEVDDFDSRDIDAYRFTPTTGHYTQVVWAETQYIGCGHITFPGGSGFRRLMVCNYGPSGNFVGDPVYIRARPCTMCPQQTSCDQEPREEEPGLCGPPRKCIQSTTSGSCVCSLLWESQLQ